MNTAKHGENQVKHGEKKKRSTARFWFVVLVIDLFVVFNTTHSVTRFFTALGVIASIVVVFRACRDGQAQAKTKTPQASVNQ